MDALQNTKILNCIEPAAIVDDDTFASNVVDTQGWDKATFIVILGALDIAVAALKVQEADAKTDATTLTSGADVTGTVFGTATNSAGSTSTLPAATDDHKVYVIEVDCRARKRYIQVAMTGGNGSNGTYAAAICILSKGEVMSPVATDRGIAQLLRA